jgi:predicted nucleic acid-binding protein
MKTLRLYLDTSVIGGYFDREFEGPTRKLFEEFAAGTFVPVVSDIVMAEVRGGPPPVRELLEKLDSFVWEEIVESTESLALAHAYVRAGILSEKWLDDCRHVAVATVCHADMIVSWNFRHIVHFDKIRAFNSVNLGSGYGIMEIRSPREVVNYDE